MLHQTSILQNKGLRLGHLILMGYAIPVLAIIASAGVTFYNTTVANDKVHLVDRLADVNQSLSDLNVQVQLMSRATRGYLLNPNAQMEQELNDAVQQSQSELSTLAQKIEVQVVASPEQTKRYNDLKAAVERLETQNRQIVETAKTDLQQTKGTTQAATEQYRAHGGGECQQNS
jgi:CHASE3 domain sensor protein